jgi:hypothetical protein
MLSERQIDANPKKFRPSSNSTPHKTRKEIQKLAKIMATLSRFIATSGERDMSFYKMLCKANCFLWDGQEDKAFLELKEDLNKIPTLVPPKPEEELLLYILPPTQ